MLAGVILILGRVYLTVVFGVACGAKLLQPAGFRRTLASLDIPERKVPLAAAAVAVAEGLVALGLWISPAARWAALAASLLLSSFALLGVLFGARQIRCHCFGALTDDTLGTATVVRNLPLAVLAAALVWRSAPVFGVPPIEWAAYAVTAAGLFLAEPLGRIAWPGKEQGDA